MQVLPEKRSRFEPARPPRPLFIATPLIGTELNGYRVDIICKLFCLYWSSLRVTIRIYKF